MKLAIANQYGNVDMTKAALPRRYCYVPGKQLQPLCRKLGIRYADAVVGWSGNRRYGFKPVKNGVVVSAAAAPKLIAAVEAREQRNPLEKRKATKRRQVERQLEKLNDAGISDPGSRTAKWFESGQIDSYEAQLIQFKASYRHTFTDYDELMNQLREEARSYKGAPRRLLVEDARQDARNSCSEQPIPNTWEAYLNTYDFPYPEVAARLAQVLKSPQRAHPIWFCEAVLAIKRAECRLDELTYEGIKQAMFKMRSM